MLKPTKSYRMSKAAKRMLATVVCPHQRGALKRGIIDAELTAAIRPTKTKEDKKAAGGAE